MSVGHLARVPVIEQMQQTECGVCCLAMVLEYYKSKESVSKIRDELQVGRDGLKLSQLYEYAKNRNMYTKVFSTDFETLKNMPLPAIIFWNHEHYIVLEKIGKVEVQVVDPAIGRISMKHQDFIQGFSNVIMILVPEEDFITRDEKNTLWGDVIRKVLAGNKLFFVTAAITLVTYFLQLLVSMVVQTLVDASSDISNYSMIGKYVYFAVVVVLVYSLTHFIRGRCMIKLQVAIDQYLTKETFSKMLKLPYQYYERRTNGDILFRLNCLPVIRDLLTNNVMTGVIQLGFIIIIMGYMLKKSILLALISSVILLLNVIFIVVVRKKVLAANQIQIVENTKLQAVQVETVQSIFNIKTAGIEEEFFSNWLSKYCKGMQAYETKNEILNFYQTALSIFKLLGPFFVLWTGLYLYTQGVLTVGIAIACYSLANTMFGACISVFHMWNDFTIATAYMERIKDITSAEEEKDYSMLKSIDDIETIEFRNVSMSYTGSSEKVLNNINLKINKGEKMAFVGKSGSGKSTLLKLLLGLYEPTSGEILVNGINLEEINRKQFRRLLGIVPQDVYLFNKSILENIRMDDISITEEQVWEAAKLAKIHDEIEQMPMKYHTIVSNYGMNLSGGQRQRIIMARAIVNNPQFLILDEATSSLDNIKEREVSEYFAKQKCTRVIVAHRLSTIEDADKIFVLENGEIVEEGKHHELLDNHGYYEQLYKCRKEDE